LSQILGGPEPKTGGSCARFWFQIWGDRSFNRTLCTDSPHSAIHRRRFVHDRQRICSCLARNSVSQ